MVGGESGANIVQERTAPFLSLFEEVQCREELWIKGLLLLLFLNQPLPGGQQVEAVDITMRTFLCGKAPRGRIFFDLPKKSCLVQAGKMFSSSFTVAAKETCSPTLPDRFRFYGDCYLVTDARGLLIDGGVRTVIREIGSTWIELCLCALLHGFLYHLFRKKRLPWHRNLNFIFRVNINHDWFTFPNQGDERIRLPAKGAGRTVLLYMIEAEEGFAVFMFFLHTNPNDRGGKRRW